MAPNSPASVAVIGGGAMGSAAAWQLALRGHRVVLLEQFGPGHRRGASHGSSRIFWHAYAHRRYINLATRADRLWRQLERLDGGRVYTRTGAVDHGHPAEVFALSRALTEAGVDNALLRPTEAALRWPGIRFDTMVLHHPAAGRIDADRAVAALQRQAVAAGADVWHHTTATGLRLLPSGVRVVTDSGHLRFDQAVLAAGAWTSKVLEPLPGLWSELPALRTTQEQPAHFTPIGEPVDWPSFIHHPGADMVTAPEDRGSSGGIYGLSSPEGVKIGEHGTGPEVDPDNRDFLPDPAGVARLQDYAANWLPGVDPASAKASTCLYTTTPDHHFVVDRSGPVTVLAGFSGHGFKFTPAIGELAAGLVSGAARAPAEFAFGRRARPSTALTPAIRQIRQGS